MYISVNEWINLCCCWNLMIELQCSFLKLGFEVWFRSEVHSLVIIVQLCSTEYLFGSNEIRVQKFTRCYLIFDIYCLTIVIRVHWRNWSKFNRAIAIYSEKFSGISFFTHALHRQFWFTVCALSLVNTYIHNNRWVGNHETGL